MTHDKLRELAHQWAIESYHKGLGKPCDIDGARKAFDAELAALKAENERMREALKTARNMVQSDRDVLVECHGGEDDLDPLAVDGAADYDKVLAVIDAALKEQGNG